jgi:aspartate aminotransferase
MAAKGCRTDVELCEQLLEQAKVALVPGSAFGAPGHVRFSFASAMATLQQAVERIDGYARS